MVDDLKMLKLIEARPGIRTVELSDRLDCPIEEIEAALQGHVELKFLDEHKVIAPNGRKAKAYTLGGVPLPDPSVAIAKAMTIVDRAIAFIQAQPERQATGAQLHNALDLKGDEAPSNVLVEGLQDGRLVKEGKYWTVGAAAPMLTMATVGVDVQADRIETLIVDSVEPVAKTSGNAIANPAPAPAGKTKVEMVIDFLKTNGKSPTSAIREVLGIPADRYPQGYLQHALDVGKIKKQGHTWWVPGYESGASVTKGQAGVAENAHPVAGIPAFLAKDPSSVAAKPEVQPAQEAADLPQDLIAQLSKKGREELAQTTAQPEAQTTILDNDHDTPHINMPRQMVKEVRDQIKRDCSPLVQRYSTVEEVKSFEEHVQDRIRQLREEKDLSDFVVALLSNSNLEIRVDGKTVTLKKAQWAHMREFINKVELA